MDQLNDDVLGSALDAIQVYGVRRFFTDVAFGILAKNNLLTKFSFMDTTSFSQSKKKESADGKLKITHGHAKNHRRDLPQFIQLLITTNNAIPFWNEIHSGNASDKDLFPDAIANVKEYLSHGQINHKFITVCDSALYTKNFLLNKEIKDMLWVSRVPESIAEAKEIVELENDFIEWNKIDNEYKYAEFTRTYCGIKQRWILVRNRKSKYKEQDALEKSISKDAVKVKKAVRGLKRVIYRAKDDAKHEIKKLSKKYPLFNFHYKFAGKYGKLAGRKRKKLIGYIPVISFSQSQERIQKKMNTKGRFIITTNADAATIKTTEAIQAYRERNANSEGCFKFLKDPTYRLSKIFLSKVERIEAMMAVIALILFINNLGQKMLRDQLAKSKTTIPNQLGKNISNPTLKWAFQLLQQIVKLQIKFSNQVIEEFHGIGEVQRKIIDCFGEQAQTIYGFG